MKRKKVDLCRNLRKNHTNAEKKLWLALRNRKISGVKFRRQFAIGPYILDFYSPKYKIAIEADGGQHYFPEGKDSDRKRSQILLSEYGVKVIRFSNLDILRNIKGVCFEIKKEIEKRNKSYPPHPYPSPQGGEGNINSSQY